MSIKVVLFDLDGTLLPMNQDELIKKYFNGLMLSAVSCGYGADAAMNALKLGTMNIAKNDGSLTGEDAFWTGFCEALGDVRDSVEPCFERFYKEEFDKLISVAEPTEKAALTVRAVRALGLRVVLATSPYFPAVATEKRMAWAGLSPSDFEFVTTYENSHFVKPRLEYYTELIQRLGVSPNECLMVGNDTSDDMVAEELKMKVFLMPRCLINRAGVDVSRYPQGDFDELLEYIKTLL